MTKSKSLGFYSDRTLAERYHRKKGVPSVRREKMYEVMLDLIIVLSSPQSNVLELGAGTGLFTERLLKTKHFREIYVTDGAEEMLSIAKKTLVAENTLLHFASLDFTTDWTELFKGIDFDVITSSMALHHADDKLRIFQQVYTKLKPNGVFVFADHMTGASECIKYLIDRERVLVKWGNEYKDKPERIRELIKWDMDRQRAEGNLCETVPQYLYYLDICSFKDIDCIWRDYWLAIFIARK
jgi:tRNA (cmo5U34)-methyltransferase